MVLQSTINRIMATNKTELERLLDIKDRIRDCQTHLVELKQDLHQLLLEVDASAKQLRKPPTETVQVSCKKRAYGSKEAVLRANSTNHHRLRAYECRFCHGWHVTKDTIIK